MSHNLQSIQLSLRQRKGVLLSLVSLPVIVSGVQLFLFPEFTARGFSSDVTHDYFYNGLLVLDGDLPNGTRHPGTPLFYIMSLIQFLWGGDPTGAIQAAGTIAKIASLLLTGGVMIGLYIAARPLLKEYFRIVILSVLILYSSPSIFYYATHFGPDVITPTLLLGSCLLLYRYLVGSGDVSGRLLGILTGVGLAMKMSFMFAVPPIFFAILAPAVQTSGRSIRTLLGSEHIAETMRYVVFSGATFAILTFPDARNYLRLVSHLLGKFLRLGTPADFAQFNVFSLIFFLTILITVCSIVIVITGLFRSFAFREVPIQLWTFFVTSALITFLVLPSIFETQVNPTSFRQAAVPLTAFFWSGAVLAVAFSTRLEELNGRRKWGRQEVMRILIVGFLLASSMSLAGNLSYVETEYQVGAEMEESVEELRAIDGRVVVNQRGFITNRLGATRNAYGPTVFFHLHGNERYAYEHFSPILLKEFSDFSTLRWKHIKYELSYEGGGPSSEGFIPDDTIFQHLIDTYKQASLSAPQINRPEGLYSGIEDDIMVSCLLIPSSETGVHSSTSVNYSTLANEAGFESYTVDDLQIHPGGEDEYISKYVKICRDESPD